MTAAMPIEIDNMPKDQFLNTPQSTLISHYSEKFTIEPLTIYEDRMEQKEPVERNIDVSGDRNRVAASMRGKSPMWVKGVTIEIELPFSGDPRLWTLNPNIYLSINPHGRILITPGHNFGKLLIAYDVTIDSDPSNLKNELNKNLDSIKQYLEISGNQVRDYNASLPGIARQVVLAREKRIEKEASIVKFLDLPIKRKDGTPNFERVPIQKRIIRPLPPVPKKGFIAEPGICDADYEAMLNLIRHAGTSFEKTPNTFGVHNEEELRDIVIAQLNTIYEGGAKAEAFNKKGKTDILLSVDGRSAFIAECKIWRGEKEFLEAIDQLLGYLTWRDCKTALIIFNKHNKEFSKILSQIQAIVEK
jgi:hypothetical protein